MPTKVARNYLNLCFSKFKKPASPQSSPITPTADRHRPIRPFSTAAAFITNYNSLYENTTSNPSFAPANDGSDPDISVAVDFITAFTSHRFFFSSPGRSNSIVESSTLTTAFESTTTSLSSSNSASDDSGGEALLNNSLAIPTYSPDPYADFRKSMEEMVEAHEEIDIAKSSWEFLHELLLCYLALNPKSTHKHVLKAFTDIAKAIKPPSPPLKASEEDGSRGRGVESAANGDHCEISSQQNDRDSSII